MEPINRPVISFPNPPEAQKEEEEEEEKEEEEEGGEEEEGEDCSRLEEWIAKIIIKHNSNSTEPIARKMIMMEIRRRKRIGIFKPTKIWRRKKKKD